jgi:putative photosynthetic complex assembly protein
MEQTLTDIRFPKLPLYLAAAVALLAVASVAVARLTTLPEESPVAAIPVLETRDLVFTDADDGSVIVTDAATQARIAVAEPGTNGFLRGMLRGLMRNRKHESIDPLTPMRLERLSNGGILLIDQATGATLPLDAYGRDNVAVFRAFLISKGGQQ